MPLCSLWHHCNVFTTTRFEDLQLVLGPISWQIFPSYLKIRWKFHGALVPFVLNLFLRKFAHDMTAVLSWHVQNCVVIRYPAVELQWHQFSIKFKLTQKSGFMKWTPCLIKSPWVTGGLCFWSGSVAAVSAAAAAVLPRLLNFPGKPLKLISSNHTWLIYGCGKIFWHPSGWPWVKVNKLPKAGRSLPCHHNKVRTAYPISTKHGRYILLIIMLSTWLNSGEILPEFCFLAIFA